MDYPLDIPTDSINQPNYRNTDSLLRTDPPARSCLTRLARSCVGQHVASNFTKGASGTASLIGSILFTVGTYEKGPTDLGAIVGASVVGLGLTAWLSSTVLSASTKPEDETLCLHVSKSALAYLLGCCVCCSFFCQ